MSGGGARQKGDAGGCDFTVKFGWMLVALYVKLPTLSRGTVVIFRCSTRMLRSLPR